MNVRSKVMATATQKLVIGWGFRFTVFDDTGESPKDVTTDVAIEFNVLGCIDAQSYERVEVWYPPEKEFRITFHPVPLLSPRAKTPQFERPVLFSDIVAKPGLVTTGGYVVARISNSKKYRTQLHIAKPLIFQQHISIRRSSGLQRNFAEMAEP
jgi:hypothetical protein